jgi:alkaline phosphatase
MTPEHHRASALALPGLSRRRFLQATPALLGGAAVLEPARHAPTAPLSPSAAHARARNLIFMVADGMSAGTLSLLEIYSRRNLGRPSEWFSLMARPGARRALTATHSLDSIVTDSAAAASAWGIGRKVNNHAVNITPDGQAPAPLLVLARDAGRRTGLVTTTRVTHATPAGFIANVPDRDLEADIADQVLDRRADVVLGGGASFFPAARLARRPDLRVVRNRADLLAGDAQPASADDADAPRAARSPTAAPNPARPLLGLFTPGHMSMEIDRASAGDNSTEPSLAEMAAAAIALLADAPAGFVLQVEGGRVDHAAHSNDAGALLHDMLAFDRAVAVAAAFAAPRDDTLLIVTTDHGNANPGLTFYGARGDRGLDTLARAAHSFEWIGAQLDRAGNRAARADAIPDVVAAAAGVTLSDLEARTLQRAVRKEPVDPFSAANELTSVIGSVLANHTGLAFMSPNHTADFVEITAIGPGADAIPPVHDNTDLHHLALAALAIR